ncbi:MAG: hypothetical protein GY943_38005 [Chloroflexi bacterium]|nr:hypothetical protein [Chloroflexota bacterium]
MHILNMDKIQAQIDNQKAALIDASQDDKRIEEEMEKNADKIADAMGSVIIPPVDDFRPPEVIASTANGPFDDGGVSFPWQQFAPPPGKQFASPPIEKTPEEQDAIAVLSSMPAIMEPVKYRQLQIDTMNTAKAQKAALEKVQAKVTGAINHRDLVIKGCELVLATLDGKPAAKRTPPKKPAATKRKGRPAKNIPPITKKVEEKKDENHTAK